MATKELSSAAIESSERRVALPARSERGRGGHRASAASERPPNLMDSCNSDLTPLGSKELSAMASRQLDLLAAGAKPAGKSAGKSKKQGAGGGGRGGNRGGGGGGDDGPPPPADAALATEAQRRYLNYAVSVITSRALPDVRDGLKPVQRRILYAMYDNLHLHPDSKTRKCATIVSEEHGTIAPNGNP